MDWITLLRSLQSDYIKRLITGCLLHCHIEGQHSEYTVISGEKLKLLRDFCWKMAEKYKRTSPVRDVFVNFLKGKLGEEVIKERLADFITDVDYDKKLDGDGYIDFTLTSDPSIGIQVKSRNETLDKARWSISAEEVIKNAVVVCVLIQEEVNEAQTEYNLFLAGFLPTQMIKLRTGKISFGIEQLLYIGGLRPYLEELLTFQHQDNLNQTYQNKTNDCIITSSKIVKNNQTEPIPKIKQKLVIPALTYLDEELFILQIKLGDERFEKGMYQAALKTYNQALQLKDNNPDIYYKRGLALYNLGNYEEAISDYSQVINLNSQYYKAYNQMGNARFKLEDYEGAMGDYSQAIIVNPDDAIAYRNRAYTRYYIGDYEGALEDYTQAIKINPNDESIDIASEKFSSFLRDRSQFQERIQRKQEARNQIHSQGEYVYRQSAQFRWDLGDCEGAIADYTQAIKTNPQDSQAYYLRGSAKYDLGDILEAVEDYNKAININPQYADAYYYRGNALDDLGNKQDAIDNFRKAADLYRHEGKLLECKKAQERAIDLEIEESLDILKF
jgi:tetratricopeptide (TPR) repeat protein